MHTTRFAPKHKLVKFAAKKLLNQLAPQYMRNLWLSKLSKTEPELAYLSYLINPEQISIDVGANRGLYIHHILKYTKNVIAFEPLPEMISTLKSFYPFLRIEGCALSSTNGVAEIRLPEYNPSWATLSSENRLEKSDSKVVCFEVETRTLDHFNLPTVSFIKIDVEGYEEDVLLGASITIERHLPNILVEIEERHKADSISRVNSMLEEFGYHGFFHDPDISALRSIKEFVHSRDQNSKNVGVKGKTGRYINNFIFTTKENLFSMGK